jgi:hypothetical protein
VVADLVDSPPGESEDACKFGWAFASAEFGAYRFVSLLDELGEFVCLGFDLLGELFKFHERKCTARLTPPRIARYTLNMTNNNSPKAGQSYKLINGRTVTVTKVTAAKVRFTWINEAGEVVPFITTRGAFANPVLATLVA